MNISTLKTAVQTGVSVGKAFLSTHRPEILLGTSIVSTLGAVVASAQAGYKSGKQIQQIETAEDRVVPAKEIANLTWMNYLPSAGLTAGALGSTAALHFVHVKEKKALATAALSAVEEVKKGLVTITGEETPEELDKKLEAATNGDVAKIQYSDGIVEELYLVRDEKTGRDIWSNETRIQEAVNNVNKWIARNGDCELNTFYSSAGYEQIPDGDDWGWSGAFLELQWDLVLKDDGRPVRRFKFRTDPAPGFDKANA